MAIAPLQILDRHEGIHPCSRGLGTEEGEIHRDAGGRSGPGRRIDPLPSIEPVVARTAVEGVITGSTVEAVVAAIAEKSVMAVAPLQILDGHEGIHPSTLLQGIGEGKIHGDVGDRSGPGRRIDPLPSIEPIVARTAVEGVVTGESLQKVVIGGAGQLIVTAAAAVEVAHARIDDGQIPAGASPPGDRLHRIPAIGGAVVAEIVLDQDGMAGAAA